MACFAHVDRALIVSLSPGISTDLQRGLYVDAFGGPSFMQNGLVRSRPREIQKRGQLVISIHCVL